MSAAAPLLASATAGPELIARPMARLQRCGGTTCPPGTCGHDDEPKATIAIHGESCTGIAGR